MIDINELRIGSCIGYYKNGFENVIYDTIKSIYFNDEDEAYHFEFDKPNFVHSHLTKEGMEPIPITEELLEHLGFQKEEDSISHDFEFKKWIDGYPITVSNLSNTIDRDYSVHIDNRDYDTILEADIQYLHQLQNAIYSGTNEELNIEILLK
jgi:hypothetical protein